MFELTTKSIKTATIFGLAMTMIVVATACAEKRIQSEAMAPIDQSVEASTEVWPTPEPQASVEKSTLPPKQSRRHGKVTRRTSLKTASHKHSQSQRSQHSLRSKQHTIAT